MLSDPTVRTWREAAERDWPYWSSGPPWTALSMDDDPWHDLLASSGRADR